MAKDIKMVPVILQMENVECGAACLAMILAYYKKYVPLEKLRLDCSVSRDGSNAKNIIIAARHYGLMANAYRYEVSDVYAAGQFPMMIHWNFNHFVVLNGFKKNMAVITDPASGVVHVSMEEFDRSFTGIAMEFEKSEQFIADGTPKSVLNFLKVRLKGSLMPILFILLLGLLSAMIGILMPLFPRIFTDSILFGHSPEWFLPLLLAMLIAMVATFIIEALQSYYLLKIRAKLSAVSGAMFMWHVLRLPVDFFVQRFAGDICERQQSNEEVAEIICTRITPVVLSTIMIGIYMTILLYYDYLIAAVGIIVAILNISVIAFSTRKNENTSRSMLRDAGKISGITIAGIDMIETIKASGAETGYFEKWAGYQTKYNNSKKNLQIQNIYYGMVPQVLQSLLNTFVLITGVYNILNGKFTIGALLSFQGFMGEFLKPVNQLVTLGQSVQDVKCQMERIEDVVNYSVDMDVSFNDILSNEFEDAEYSKLSGNIEIKNITFGYSPLGVPLFENLSLTIEKGQTIAIVGGSGSGKSTLAKLIAGLYKLRSGEILFDGKPKSQIDRNVFSGSVGVVDQAATVFNETIKNNITMWNHQIGEKTVINACKDAQIHEDIIKRSGGYDNIILEGGRNLSGGQRQRIDIARALAINPTIILLDEATSALDPTTEKLIMDAIKRRGITAIMIAHRLSAIRDADKIIFLEKGVVVEEGTHDQLMEQNGKYAKLVQSE